MLIYIPFGLLVLAAFWAVSIYNGLIRGRNMVKEAASGIDVQLKRRHDLIPEARRNRQRLYGPYKNSVLEEVARLRCNR